MSQEWIDRNRFEVNGWIEAVHVEDLQYLLVPKQDKPVIPQFVADLVESYRETPLVELLHDVDYVSTEEIENFRRWFHDKMGFESSYSEFLARAWLDGYEVEKEKRYYVLDHLGKTMLFKIDGFVERSFGYEVTKLPSSPDTSYLLTETEIKDFDERYWAFAQEVTE